MTYGFDDIEALFQGRFSSGFLVNYPGEDGELTQEEKTWRVMNLTAVLASLQGAWDTGSEELDRMAEKLGDGSRDGKNARLNSSGHGC